MGKPIDAFEAGTTIEEMLAVKPFDDLIADGDIFDIQGASARLGYCAAHLRRLCHARKVPYFKRTLQSTQYFFYPWDLDRFFKRVDIRPSAR